MLIIRKNLILITKTILGLSLIILSNLSYAKNLLITLKEAENLAIDASPELQKLLTNNQALNEKAIFERQLPDPKFMVGAENVPTNSFSFTQDDMTMISLGLQQSLPPGKSLKMKSQQKKFLAEAELYKFNLQKLIILRNLREAWLDYYYWTETINLLQKTHMLFKDLLKTTTSQYAANKTSQANVFEVQLELTRLQNQQGQAKQNLDITRAKIRRWLGENNQYIFETKFPVWSAPPPLALFKEHLQKHPILAVDKAAIAAARSEVYWAKEQYKPGLMVDMSYGLRQGTMADGEKRSDFVSTNLTMDLPIFPRNRQNRQHKASCYEFEGAKLEQQVHFLDLQQELTMQYANWESLSERAQLYQQQLVPVSRQNAKSALLSYQNATADFATLLRARNGEFAAQLETLQMQIEQAKARVALLYLQGTCE